MDIQFETEELRLICTSKTVAERKFGELVARQLQSRLSDLRALDDMSGPLVGLKDSGQEDSPQTWVVDLTNGYEMVFDANNRNPPLDSNGHIDWKMTDRVKIVAIGKGGDA